MTLDSTRAAHLPTMISRHFYVFVFAAAAVFFYALLFVFDVQTDIQKHVPFAAEMLGGENFPATFLYFAAVAVVALFRADESSLLVASLVVLALAVAYKFFLTVKFFVRRARLSEFYDASKALWTANAIGVGLILAFCLYLPKEFGLTNYFFLGQIPPNVWHNSTTIFVMPLALLLYWHSSQLLEKFETKTLWLTIGLVALNIFAKPNFFLCFFIVFPFVALVRYRFGREFWLNLLPPVIGLVLLAAQYVAIYRLGAYGYGKPEESGVTIVFLTWWRMFAANIPISILISAAFPLAYLVFYFKRVIAQPSLAYAYLLFVAGVLMLAFLGETGERAAHGNFQWGAIIANYILFFAAAADLMKNVAAARGGKTNAKDKILAAIFALHVLSGCLYLVKTLTRGNYG